MQGRAVVPRHALSTLGPCTSLPQGLAGTAGNPLRVSRFTSGDLEMLSSAQIRLPQAPAT